jgi:hypothetical protein
MAFCTNCGTKLTDGAKFCASCGVALSGITTASPTSETANGVKTSTVKSFFEKLDLFEQQIYEDERKNQKDVSAGSVFLKAVGFSGMIDARKGPSAEEKRKIEMIESFQIPNSKDEIIEFIMLASSRIKEVKGALSAKLAGMGINTGADVAGIKSRQRFNEVWKAKCIEAYTKAQIMFDTDYTTLAEIEQVLRLKNITIK